MLIRPLEPDDVESYTQLRLFGLQETPDAFGSSYEEEILFARDEMAARLVLLEEEFTIGGVDGDHSVVGMAKFRRELRPKSQHRAGVFGMYVHPEARGHGVGGQILAELIRRARGISGLESIYLDVASHLKPATRLYLSAGFERYGTDRRALKIGEDYFDIDLMVLRL